MKQVTTCARFTAVIVAGVLWGGSAQAQFRCMELTQITDGPDTYTVSFDPKTDSVGRWVTYYSFADLVPGGNTDGSAEIFLYDTANDALTQITAQSDLSLFASSPDISGDGTLVAFGSNIDLLGTNGDTNGEIFGYDVATDTLFQITDTTSGDTFVPRLSNDAGRLVVYSTADLVPGGNPDGNLEIYWYDVALATFHQVTATAVGNSFIPTVSADGSWIVFSSNADLVSGGNADGNLEIFMYEIDTGAFLQVTDTTGGDIGPTPAISGDGSIIAFIHDGDLVPGGNPTFHPELFLFRRVAGTFEQITSDLERYVDDPVLSADGRTLVYSSIRFFPGDPEPELNFFDLATSTQAQVIPEAWGGTRTDVSDNATSLFLNANYDPTGGNADEGHEIFMARCALFVGGFESGDLSAWDVSVP